MCGHSPRVRGSNEAASLAGCAAHRPRHNGDVGAGSTIYFLRWSNCSGIMIQRITVIPVETYSVGNKLMWEISYFKDICDSSKDLWCER